MTKTSLGGIDIGDPRKRRALVLSLWDGILTQAMIVLVDTFAVAAALSLKAPAMAISLLSSLPILLGSFSQAVMLARIDPARSRKHYVVMGVRAQALLLIGAGIAGWLPASVAPWVFVGSIVLYGVSGALFQSLWMTWFSDLVPDRIMGRLIAWRSIFFSLTQLTVSLSVGLLARGYTLQTAPWLFFCVVMVAACIMRLGSAELLARQYEPRRKKPFVPLSLRDLHPGRELVLFAVATGLFNGSAGMAGPFFGVWYLRDLHFNYLSLAIATSCMVLGNILSARLWGRLVDRAGAAHVLRTSVLMATLVPFPYLFSRETWAIWLFNLYSGIAWGGVGVSSFKYLLRRCRTEHPEMSITFVNCTQAVMIFALSMLGGYLATRLPEVLGYRLRTLFLVSMLMRSAVYFTLFTRIREAGEPPTTLERIYQRSFQILHFPKLRWPGSAGD